MKPVKLFLSVLFLTLMFVPVHAQDIDTKVYHRLTNEKKDGLTDNWVLDLREDQEGIKPEMREPSESVSQLWRFVEVGNGFFRVINASQPLMSLDVIQHPEIDTYRYMALAPTKDVSGQHWKLSPHANGIRLTNRWQADQSIGTDEFGTKLEKTGNDLGQVWRLHKTDLRVIEIMELTSTSFKDGARIPVSYTGEGNDISPPLAWKDAPAGTKSFMIICTDPDAPSAANPDPVAFVHWIILNIPADTRYLLPGVPRLEQVSTPFGAQQGLNGFGEIGYAGPMPPAGSGPHRYFFRIFALDRVLVLDPNLTPEELLKTIQKSTLAVGQLMGTYEIRASSFQDSRFVWQKSALSLNGAPEPVMKDRRVIPTWLLDAGCPYRRQG